MSNPTKTSRDFPFLSPATIRIADATPPRVVAPLLKEYLTAHLADVGQRLGVWLEPEPVVRDDLAHLDQFDGPAGCLLIGRRGDELIGCVGLRPIEAHGYPVGEIKRLYVRDVARGLGVGRQLVQAVIQRARQAGHSKIVLDTFDGMTAARSLYTMLGFVPIPPYGAAELPAQLHRH